MGRTKVVQSLRRRCNGVIRIALACIALFCITLALTTCGSSGTINTPADDNAIAPSLAELSDMLTAELERLGKDPSKVVSAAPSGSGNAVFDLSANILGDSGITLSWTERLLGDYDQNGEVNLSDLSQLAINWKANVDYDDPGMHGGFAGWPTGDPDDAGASNWRKARVDGDSNSEINLTDITPIAIHFKERLDGYRVYRKAPGESQFTQNAVVPRPVVGSTGLYQYTYSEEPPETGTYDYYVIAYSNNQGQGESKSNIAGVTLEAGFSDTTAPIWDDTIGIANVVDNTDSTVTVEWGNATDTAVPPAPNSPPVTYNMYYSTATPLDIEIATKVSAVSSPWISPQLSAGQEYYFAVRAQDSANPPNEEGNVAELPVFVSGDPVPDEDYPVFTELDRNGELVQSIRQIEVLDGELVITCADAMDVLNPPVHYDLYFGSGREHDDGDLQRSWPEEFPEGIQVIEDIPKVYSFPWENRHPVVLLVQIRDSADPPNEYHYQGNYEFPWIESAPCDVERILLDSNLPGAVPSEYSFDAVDHAMDPESHTLYRAYAVSPDGATTTDTWCMKINMDTGHWDAEFVTTSPDPLGLILSIARSWTGDIWLEVDENYPRGMYHRIGDDQWEHFDVETPAYWDWQFDHNGYPAFFTHEPSDVQSGRRKLFYHYYDEESGVYVPELVSDPGAASGTTFRRPDGVLQVISSRDAAGWGDETPRFARVFERFPDGNWETILVEEGVISPNATSLNQHTTWNSKWAWFMHSTIHGFDEYYLYGQDGYEFVTSPIINGLDARGGKVWPADGGGVHILPNYLTIDSETQFYEFFGLSNYLAVPVNDYSGFKSWGGGYGILFNPLDGYFAVIVNDYDLGAQTHGTYLIKPANGKTIFIP